MTPTFFYYTTLVSAIVSRSNSRYTTYPSALDQLGNLDEVLLVFGSILATDENLDWDSATLDLVKVLGCTTISFRSVMTGRVISAPFFWVVMI